MNCSEYVVSVCNTHRWWLALRDCCMASAPNLGTIRPEGPLGAGSAEKRLSGENSDKLSPYTMPPAL